MLITKALGAGSSVERSQKSKRKEKNAFGNFRYGHTVKNERREGGHPKGKTCSLTKHSWLLLAWPLLFSSPSLDPFTLIALICSYERRTLVAAGGVARSRAHFTATAAAAPAIFHAGVSGGGGGCTGEDQRLLAVEPRLLLGDERLHRLPERLGVVRHQLHRRRCRCCRTPLPPPAVLRLGSTQLRRRRRRRRARTACCCAAVAGLVRHGPPRGLGAHRLRLHRLLVRCATAGVLRHGPQRGLGDTHRRHVHSLLVHEHVLRRRRCLLSGAGLRLGDRRQLLRLLRVLQEREDRVLLRRGVAVRARRRRAGRVRERRRRERGSVAGDEPGEDDHDDVDGEEAEARWGEEESGDAQDGRARGGSPGGLGQGAEEHGQANDLRRVHEYPRHHAGAGQRGPGVGGSGSGSHRSQSQSQRHFWWWGFGGEEIDDACRLQCSSA